MTRLNESPDRTRPFEFGTQENRLFTELGSRMQFVGLFSSAMGFLALVLGMLSLTRNALDPVVLGVILSGVVHLAIGVWTRTAGGEFRQIVRTEGADLAHLMRAIGNLRKFFTLWYWLAILTLVLFGVLLVTSLIYRSPAAAVAPVA